MKYYDIYDEEIHDNDKVIASDKHGEISVGIFNNSKIFTDLGPINATHFINIVKVNNLDTVNNTVKDINKMYCKQLNSDVKEISVFDLDKNFVKVM